jgi:hypothetical protein
MTDCNCRTCQALPTKHRLASLLIAWLDASQHPTRAWPTEGTLDALNSVATLYPPQWNTETNDPKDTAA